MKFEDTRLQRLAHAASKSTLKARKKVEALKDLRQLEIMCSGYSIDEPYYFKCTKNSYLIVPCSEGCEIRVGFDNWPRFARPRESSSVDLLNEIGSDLPDLMEQICVYFLNDFDDGSDDDEEIDDDFDDDPPAKPPKSKAKPKGEPKKVVKRKHWSKEEDE